MRPSKLPPLGYGAANLAVEAVLRKARYSILTALAGMLIETDQV